MRRNDLLRQELLYLSFFIVFSKLHLHLREKLFNSHKMTFNSKVIVLKSPKVQRVRPVLIIGFFAITVSDNLSLLSDGKCSFCDNLALRVMKTSRMLPRLWLDSQRASHHDKRCKPASLRVFPPAVGGKIWDRSGRGMHLLQSNLYQAIPYLLVTQH